MVEALIDPSVRIPVGEINLCCQPFIYALNGFFLLKVSKHLQFSETIGEHPLDITGVFILEDYLD